MKRNTPKHPASLPIQFVKTHSIHPSPENALLYKPPSETDPEIIELAESIRQKGLQQPLSLSADYYIISGHKRHCAALLAGMPALPCQIHPAVTRGHGERARDEYVRLIRENNRQRVKSADEVLRESIIDVDPDKALTALTAYRKRKARIKVEPMELREGIRRKEISEAKIPFLRAVEKIIDEQQDFWPLSLRQIHYQLLNDPPLKHSDKPESRYCNDLHSYKSLVDLATRARHEGYIDHETIDDPTRPITTWDVQRSVSTYYAQQMEGLLRGYWRDLLQSQANHIELVVEKNTLSSLVRPISAEFCIPFTIGRGQCSTPPLSKITKRYEASGKEKLIILAVSDLDPDGDAIAHSLGQRLRDDFNIAQVSLIKVALTMEQITELGLPEKFERAKDTSRNYARYVEKYQSNRVWELEAVPPRQLQQIIRDAVDAVLDRKAFNHEVANERRDAQHIEAVRNIVLNNLRQQTGERSDMSDR